MKAYCIYCDTEYPFVKEVCGTCGSSYTIVLKEVPHPRDFELEPVDDDEIGGEG